MGSSEVRRADVRIIATSNRDVEGEVRKGKFREDLYFRLAVVPVKVPALREHKEDIPELVQYFVRNFACDMGRRNIKLVPGTMERLAAYDWPGNVRELANAVERSLVLSTSDELDIAVEGGAVLRGKDAVEPGGIYVVREGMKMEEVERGVILATLGRLGGHRKNTADALGVSERALREKIKKYKETGVYNGD